MVRDMIILLYGLGKAYLLPLKSRLTGKYIDPSSVTGGLIEVEFSLALNSIKKIRFL